MTDQHSYQEPQSALARMFGLQPAYTPEQRAIMQAQDRIAAMMRGDATNSNTPNPTSEAPAISPTQTFPGQPDQLPAEAERRS